MEIHGYEVTEAQIVVNGEGKLAPADRPCDICLGHDSKILKVKLEGMPEQVRVCPACMIKGGLFLSMDDLQEEIYEMCGGRGRG